MRLSIVAVGRLKQSPMRALMDDYLGRIRRYVPCDEIEVKREADLEGALSGQSVCIALEVHGRGVTSSQLSRLVEQWALNGKGKVAFIIGGAEGIPKRLSESAAERISLSTLTLPHRLARVVLAEQLYRAMTILRGEPYARE